MRRCDHQNDVSSLRHFQLEVVECRTNENPIRDARRDCCRDARSDGCRDVLGKRVFGLVTKAEHDTTNTHTHLTRKRRKSSTKANNTNIQYKFLPSSTATAAEPAAATLAAATAEKQKPTQTSAMQTTHSRRAWRKRESEQTLSLCAL